MFRLKFPLNEALVLGPSFVPEKKKMGLNKEGANQKWYSHNKQEFSVIERSQPEGVKPKMRERRL